MSSETEKNASNAELHQSDEQIVDDVDADAVTEAANEDANAESVDIKALQESLAKAEEKIAENWSLFLSAKAEADNIRKRAERDVTNAHKYALEKFIPELLAVKDALELGTKAASESNDGADDQTMSKFIEGSEMAITMFADALKKVGVEMVNPEGELFNPELHQAMTMIPNPELPANTVIEVIQKGYTLNERLLRPAMVIVSKAD